ncbi:MAG TPA: acyltransferase, partial [Rhodopila sp.]
MARRLLPLDSLRGIAAVVVVLQHALTPSGGLPDSLPRTAVMIFFVLSGYVLSIPWIEGRPPAWSSYAIRRICRLWPPVAVAVLASLVLYSMTDVHARPVDGWWQQPVTPLALVRCLLLTGQEACVFVPPSWSLVFEARASMLFPLLALFVVTRPRFMLAIAVVFGFLFEIKAYVAGIYPEPMCAAHFATGLLLTSHFTALFVFGALLARRVHTEQDWFTASKSVVLLVASALLAIPHSDTLKGVGAVLLLLTIIGSPAVRTVLMFAPFRWLGRVSYSLYVIHWPVMLFVFYHIGGPGTLAGLLLALLACGIAAEGMHRWVEAPSIRLGKWLSGYSDQAAIPPRKARHNRSWVNGIAGSSRP